MINVLSIAGNANAAIVVAAPADVPRERVRTVGPAWTLLARSRR